MNKLISRSSLHFFLGSLAFLPLVGILSAGSSNSQPVSRINSKTLLMQSASKPSQNTQRYTNSTYALPLATQKIGNLPRAIQNALMALMDSSVSRQLDLIMYWHNLNQRYRILVMLQQTINSDLMVVVRRYKG